jgi:adenylate cyclase
MTRLVASDLARRDVVHRQWSLAEGIVLPLGRGVHKDQLLTEWDEQIAARQAVVTWKDGRLHVAKASEQNGKPIFYGGREADDFQIMPGEGFVIGRTVFRLEPRADGATATASAKPSSVKQTHFYAAEELHTMDFHPTEEQLTAVRDLLYAMEASQANLDAFAKLVVGTVRRVIRSARYVAVLEVHSRERRVVMRAESDASPGLCEKLVLEACRRQETAEYCWEGNQTPPTYEPVKGIVWTCCAPVIARQEGQGDLALYLAGPPPLLHRGTQPRALTEDECVFIGIVAWILRAVRTIHDLARSQASVQAFLPKPIRNLLQQKGPEEAFRTEHAQAAVLFCDLRGSCKIAERGADDLQTSWDRLQAALSLMTESITNQYGTIGDFVGDAAMGFWGWPKTGSASRDLTEAVKAACKAADILRERLRQKSRGAGPLAGFACGMGIAAGEVVAGMLGTEDQRKIGVFGPVVNLAARLESMTKQFGSAILIDQTAANLLVRSETTLQQQVRYLAKVLPVGMEQAVKVFELMPPEADESRLSRAKLQLFEQGQQAFEQGNWTEARRFLERMQDVSDGPSKFLLEHMGGADAPPPGFAGVVQLSRK